MVANQSAAVRGWRVIDGGHGGFAIQVTGTWAG
jgi:hypothetical protein